VSVKRYRTPCVYCGATFLWTGRGRQPLFCSSRCRTASHRAAERGECVTPADCRGDSHSNYCEIKRERAAVLS